MKSSKKDQKFKPETAKKAASNNKTSSDRGLDTLKETDLRKYLGCGG